MFWFNKIYSPKTLAKAFRFDRHPLWKELLDKQRHGARQNWIKAVNCLMYCENPTDRYWRNERAKAEKKRVRHARAEKVKMFRRVMQTERTSKRAQMMNTVRRGHMSSRMRPGQVFSVPRTLARVLGLSDAVSSPALPLGPAAPRCTRRRVLLEDGDCADTGLHGQGGGEQPPQREPQICFKLVSMDAGAGKHIKGAPATSSWLCGGDLAVTFHNKYEDDDGCTVSEVRALRAPASAHSVSLLRFDSNVMELVEQHLVEHPPCEELEYMLEDAPPALLAEMLNASAWRGSARHHVVPAEVEVHRQALASLQNAGLAICTNEDAANSMWQLTPLAGERLRITERLEPPRQVFSQCLTLPWNQMTEWELMKALEDAHWRQVEAPTKLQDRLQLQPWMPDDDGGESVWYTTGSSVPLRLYMV